MVKHIVFWKLLPQANGQTAAANAEEMKTRLEALNGQIPGLRCLEVGIDVSRTPASADVALYSELDSREALDAYQQHPAHLAVGQWVGSVTAERSVVDYEQ